MLQTVDVAGYPPGRRLAAVNAALQGLSAPAIARRTQRLKLYPLTERLRDIEMRGDQT